MPDNHGEDHLIEHLARSVRDKERITLLIGSGVTAPLVPRVSGILELADRYAGARSDDGDLSHALAQARRELGPDAAEIDVYIAYRRVFADWVSGEEFDVVAQQAVLQAYRPPEWSESPLAMHGIWQRVDLQLGERAENTTRWWALPEGVDGISRLLSNSPDAFGNRVLTTNFDPLIEIAIRRAGDFAVGIPVEAEGWFVEPTSTESPVRVFHLHGFWRPTGEPARSPLLHDPGRLTDPSPALVQRIADLINGDVVCVVGYGGWDRAVTAALRSCVERRRLRVLWALHGEIGTVQRTLAEVVGEAVDCYGGVESDRLFTKLADALGMPRTENNGERRRVRHLGWERELISQPHSNPPLASIALLEQLERRFGWGRGGPISTAPPNVVFWPIRLRERASLIHAVQALAAGALAARGVRLAVCLDDFGVPNRRAVADLFKYDLLSWIRQSDPDADPDFVSLTDFHRRGSGRTAISDDPPARPTNPWTIARMLYGELNPSLYSVLAAIKVVPHVPLRDLEEHALSIVHSLQSKNANRLLTPLVVWPYLNHLLLEEPVCGVITLGGRDEGPFWELWRSLFGSGVHQLYNPHIKSLSNESGMVRWSTRQELRDHLARAQRLEGWDDERSYIPWLFQNALLLPIYLRNGQAPEVNGYALDCWASFHAALEEARPALDVLADRASDLYLGKESP